MSKLKVYDMAGGEVGDLEVDDSLLVSDKGGMAVQESVLMQLAARRAGTASTLNKGEVAGSGIKPWRQKGTGRARAGYRQSPVWRGGAVAFGPRPRSFGGKLNKKVKRLAFRRALSERVLAGDVRVLDGLTLEQPKTRMLTDILKALKIERSALIVVESVDRNLRLASRNVPGASVVQASDVNALQLLRHPEVIVTRPAMAVVEARLRGKTGEAADEGA